MPLNPSAAEDSIVEELEDIIPRVYDTEVPDGVSPVYPMIVCYFGDPIRTARGRNILSVKNDPQRAYVLVQVASETVQSTKDIYGAVREKLIGFCPDNSGEMVPEGLGVSYSRSNGNSKPTVYYREAGFSYITNLEWND